MVQHESFYLANGLKVIVHEDHKAPVAVVNLLYKVGARDEDPEKTGFAHLFEHLMFGGSKHIPSYDEPLQRVGGDNNAFTSNDITNYYITLPAKNLETAFWLESDRMMSLSFDPEVLRIQRDVVIEEFKQRYLNQPYGDVWLKLRPLCYQVHPYRWPTIGKQIAHVERATMEDVKDFFYRYYLPNNATLVVAGDVTVEEVKRLSEKWFGPIPAGKTVVRNLPEEPEQTAYRMEETTADVPLHGLYMAFQMPERMHPDYHAVDLLSDVLGRGKSSRLYQSLVEESHIFNNLSAHVSGAIDKGLFVIEGLLAPGKTAEIGEKAVWDFLDAFKKEALSPRETEKVKIKAESTVTFSNLELLNRAMNLAYFDMLGDANQVNTELDAIRKVTANDIMHQVNLILQRERASVLRYHAKN